MKMNEAAVVFLACLPLIALADEATAPAGEAVDSLTVMDTVTVNGSRFVEQPVGARSLDRRVLKAERANTSDTARLLENIPGVSTYGAGGISSLPVVQGIADDRLRTQVDGMDLMTACPNHMNPAMSFIDPSRVASIEVYAGIAPVSIGGDSIGGSILVKPQPPKFAAGDEDYFVSGQIGAFYRSNGHANGNNVAATLATQTLSFSYARSFSESDNYWAASDFKKPGVWKTISENPIKDNVVAVSEYWGSVNEDFRLAWRPQRDHLFQFSYGEQKIDYEGFPNQRMDMISSVPSPSDPLDYSIDKKKPSNVNRTSSLSYLGRYDWGELEGRYFHQHLRHHMDYIQDRFFGMLMPMDTVASTDGGVLKASINLSDSHLLRLGTDFQKYRLADWWPPINAGISMCCNDFWNIRDGKRDRIGYFSEWEANWTSEWMSLIGARYDRVRADAGRAQGYSNSYSGDAASFNAIDHERKDEHIDAMALLRFTPDQSQNYDLGIARKTRSPNLYERYPWSYNSMAALMNNFVGDGNAYIGNPDLRPEVAHTISTTGDWHDPERERWGMKATAYLTYVDDYIDAQRCTQAMNTQCTAANATTTNSYVKLRYANQSAMLYGLDLSGQRLLARGEGLGNLSINAMVSYVRGENRTTGDNLYHIMPLNAKLALVHRFAGLTNTLEMHAVGGKHKTSQVRNEVETPGYTLFNLRSSYEWKHARIDLAIENLFDKFYYLPLGGAYVGQGNSMTISGVPWGMVVPGRGRSLNVALNLSF
ncbi:MAG: TonB-dependent receptor [Proteobacteria bacterium]|nr:TonB-dependent receptor [Pseudomonadota bacterium]